MLLACGDSGPPAATDPARAALERGEWEEAAELCPSLAGESEAASCEVRYCELIANGMMFLDELNDFLLPSFRSAEIGLPSGGLERYLAISLLMDETAAIADEVAAGGCSFDLKKMPIRIGEAADPVVVGEVRGRWTTRSALMLASIIDSIRYVFASTINGAPTPPPPDGSDVPGLPALLERIRSEILRQDQLLANEPADPKLPQGGWLDRNRDGRIDPGDELLIDIFEPGTNRRIFDFSEAELITAEDEPLGVITQAESLPPARCGYESWHIDTLFESPDVGTTDGMSFSPDGTKLVLPMKVNNRYEIHVMGVDGSNPVCLTCDSELGWDDGVRWSPTSDVLVFVSSRDHPLAIGGAGGGAGQELYAMRADGSEQTRLTTSPFHATNYHVNWSFDGKKIVFGTTRDRTWDVMVADFVDDGAGMRLENEQRLTHDTSWWETHGFTTDGSAVITTNTRAGWQSADIYTVALADGRRTRITNDVAWDEHAHLSPDGRKLSWISARWRPAGMQRLTDGSLSPAFDFFWIAPAILFSFYNPPAGFSTELTLMDADGGSLNRLTFDDDVVADNEWSRDATKIVYRSTPNDFPREPASIRLLTFDDCAP